MPEPKESFLTKKERELLSREDELLMAQAIQGLQDLSPYFSDLKRTVEFVRHDARVDQLRQIATRSSGLAVILYNLGAFAEEPVEFPQPVEVEIPAAAPVEAITLLAAQENPEEFDEASEREDRTMSPTGVTWFKQFFDTGDTPDWELSREFGGLNEEIATAIMRAAPPKRQTIALLDKQSILHDLFGDLDLSLNEIAETYGSTHGSLYNTLRNTIKTIKEGNNGQLLSTDMIFADTAEQSEGTVEEELAPVITLQAPKPVAPVARPSLTPILPPEAQPDTPQPEAPTPPSAEVVSERHYELLRQAVEHPEIVSVSEWEESAEYYVLYLMEKAGFTVNEAKALWTRAHFDDQGDYKSAPTETTRAALSKFGKLFGQHFKAALEDKHLETVALRILANQAPQLKTLDDIALSLNKNDKGITRNIAQRYVVAGMVEVLRRAAA